MGIGVYQTILARRSIRQYTDEPVGADHIRRLLEAAMAAPSGHNKRPWHFIVVTDRQALNRLADKHPWGKMLRQAPLAIAVCGDPTSEFWVHDGSAAAENILLTATELDLGSVWLCAHPYTEIQEHVRETLDIPAEIAPLCLVAIGHPLERKEPRTQYDESRVHRERW